MIDTVARRHDSDNVLLAKILTALANGISVSSAPPAALAQIETNTTQLANDFASYLIGVSNNLWRAGGFSNVVSSNPNVATAAYSAGDTVGGKRTLAAARITNGPVVLQSVIITDKSDQKAEFWLIFFSADPTSSTLTDADAFSLHADDVAKVVGIVHVAADDYVDTGAVSIATKAGIGLVMKPTGVDSLNLYCAAVCVGTPDYVAAGDLAIQFGFLQD